MNGAVLQVHDLGFSYGARPLLHGWSHGFGQGLTWIRGRNGCGKSTLLKLLAGALPPDRGRIAVAGIDQQAQPLAYRREVFWVGPGAPPFDHLTPAEYFAFLRGLYPRWDEDAQRTHATGFGLEAVLATPLARLSTGTQRKVWVTAGLAAGTAATLLDEPVAALDVASCGYLASVLGPLAAAPGRAWLVCSHEALDGVPVQNHLDLESAGLLG